ncbi:hypothetical protein [Methylomonas sp. TEB]|uniref:hypothetical protein n=1 Tax=Methylomonas sp. TEB TaxID=3398229 RepID=UPI0039F51C12
MDGDPKIRETFLAMSYSAEQRRPASAFYCFGGYGAMRHSHLDSSGNNVLINSRESTKPFFISAINVLLVDPTGTTAHSLGHLFSRFI